MAVTGVCANGLSTSGKPELSSSCRRSAGSCLAAVGITESTARSTSEPRTPDAMAGRLAEASGSATSQAATTTASACRIEPSVESTGQRALAGDAVAHAAAEEHAGGLAEHDQQHDDGDAHDHPRARVVDALGQQRGDAHPDDRAAEHADEGQQRDRHAVPPARHRRDQRERDDDEIDPAHRAPSPAHRRRRAGRCVAGSFARPLTAPALMAPRPPDGRLVPRPTRAPGRGSARCSRGASTRPDPTARTISPR